MRIVSFLVFTIGIAYAFMPEISGAIPRLGVEAMLARATGPLIASLAAMTLFPSLRSARYVNCAIGFFLVLSPLAVFRWDATALVVQAIVGFWTLGLSLLSKHEHKPGGGWRGSRLLLETDQENFF